jgi:hypothetical protein
VPVSTAKWRRLPPALLYDSACDDDLQQTILTNALAVPDRFAEKSRFIRQEIKDRLIGSFGIDRRRAREGFDLANEHVSAASVKRV